MQIALRNIHVILLITALYFSSCSTKKQFVEEPSYASLSMRGQAILELDQHEYSMNCTARIWPNQLITLSLQPLLGIEMIRAEITPDSIAVFDKLNRRYTALDYASINRIVRPKVSYAILQKLVTEPALAGTNTSDWWELTAEKYHIKFQYKVQSCEKNTLSQPTRTNTDRYTVVTLREILPL